MISESDFDSTQGVYVKAPQIRVVLRPVPNERYELWLVLHVPEGLEPNTVRLGRGSYDQKDATKMILNVYTSIAARFAFDGTADGSKSAH